MVAQKSEKWSDIGRIRDSIKCTPSAHVVSSASDDALAWSGPIRGYFGLERFDKISFPDGNSISKAGVCSCDTQLGQRCSKSQNY